MTVTVNGNIAGTNVVTTAGVATVNGLSGTAVLANGHILSNVYTPTITNSTNVTASTAYQLFYSYVDGVVNVSGKVDITPTASSQDTKILLTLPVATTFTQDYQAGGDGSEYTVDKMNMTIYADTASGTKVACRFYATNNTAHSFWFNFSYQVL